MKKIISKCMVAFMAVAIMISCISPVSLKAASDPVLDDRTKSILEAAEVMTSYSTLMEEGFVVESNEKKAVQDAILHNYGKETDISQYGLTSKEMDEIVDEVLNENHMESTVEVTYETDEEDKVTTMSVEMDSMVAMVGEEAAGMTAEQKEELMGKYSEYMSFMQQNADIFGVQTPYFTNKDNICPIGSLLAIAGIPNEYLAYGLDFLVQNNIMPYDQIVGVVDMFHYANMFTVQLKKADIEAARDKALNAVSDAKTDVQKHLQLTNWLAQNCTFDMPYIMEMQAPEEDTESAMYKDKMTIYNAMYTDIKQKYYDGYYQYLVYMEGYPEDMAAQVAEMMAKSAMDDPTGDESKPNGSQSAMTLASSIINLWEGSHVGALTYGTAVCLGYSNAYVYLVQSLYSNIYKNADGSWKTYDQLNSGSDGSWNAIVDYVRITFDAEVTMYGVTQENFQSDHYWNAVKLDGKWYYVDPCYVDVYVEVMARDRVETNGNVNHLYFMFSHETAEELYDGYYKELDTLYNGIATDKTYEDAWFAFAKSPVYRNNDRYYYVYDSTDLIEMQDNYEITEEDIVYKLVYKNAGSSNRSDAHADYDRELIDFIKGTVYDPDRGRMSSNSLISKYYAEMKEYKEDYPSLVITTAYYNDKLYFNLSNCIFSYDLNTGDVTRLIEYNNVTAERDMTVAFGGMGFTKSDQEGEFGITVKEPPIAGFTIRDGQMTVDIATTAGYISGKNSHTYEENEPEDTSSYGYMFEETHYNPEYLYATYSEFAGLMDDVDTYNDNDEFMWSANIYETIDMNHLTGAHDTYSAVTVDATCTTESYQENRCDECGLIQNGNSETGNSIYRATHEYVRFKEKYYTKTDTRWNTKVYYVCIHCKDAVGQNPGNLVEPDQDNMTNVWTWAVDGSAASVYSVPTELAHINLDCVWENPSIGSSRKKASSIKRAVEGFCDEGVTCLYTAKYGSLSDEKRVKQPEAPHQYVADDIQYSWNETFDKCDITYKCDFCGKEETSVCEGEAITKTYVDPTCTVDGKTIYTSSIVLEGNVYTGSTETFNDNKALGHEFVYSETENEEICARCQEIKPFSKITLPENYRGVYTGKKSTELEKQCIIEGSQGEVTITYYKDKACTKKLNAAPSKMGIYYAVAFVEEDDQYKEAESAVCKFIIGPDSVSQLKESNVTNGVKLTWKKVDEAVGYEIYRRSPEGNYQKIDTLNKNTILEWVDEDVVEGKTYIYDVRTYAKTSAGTVRCKTNEKGASILRTVLTSSNTKKNGVSLKWTEVPKATMYKVYRKAIGTEEKYTAIATLDSSMKQYNDTKVKNGVKYYYYVQPDTSGTTNVVTRVYLKTPEIKSVTTPKTKQLKVTWTKNEKADGYRIRYSTSQAFKNYKTVKINSEDTLIKSLTDLNNNTKYYVKIQAYKKNSGTTYYSAWSDVISKTTK